MVGIVLASHGEFCLGLKNSVEMVAGEIAQCETAPLYPGIGPEEYGEELEAKIDAVDTGDGALVLCDIKGGTPFNRALYATATKNIVVFVGTNLPMLLVANLGRLDNPSLEELAQLVDNEGRDTVERIIFDDDED